MREKGRITLLVLLCWTLSALSPPGFHASQDSQDLRGILERARAYLDTYEQQLGTLIGEELYVQKAVWAGQTGPMSSLAGGRVTGSGAREQRRLSSDFLLTEIGSTWYGVRSVISVDGRRVKTQDTNFNGFLGDSPEVTVQRISAINAGNSKYNLGDFVRTINVPTYSLMVLRRVNAEHFTFEKVSEKSIDNVKTWEVSFVESGHPALVQGLNHEDRYQHGKLWIDPVTGTIRKTETTIEAKASGGKFQASVTVSYKTDVKLGMLLPDTMAEHYETNNHYVDCLAEYSKFRRFETDVKLDIGTEPQ
jgi:hypothetical protein